MATSPFAAPLMGPSAQFFDANGNPLSGGKLYAYAAGTSTPQSTFPTYVDGLNGTNANANPVILDSAGRAVIFCQALGYKFVLQDSGGATLWTVDNVTPAGAYPIPYPTEWVDFTAYTPTFVTSTSFSFPADTTATFHVGRRIKTANTGGTVYSTIRSASFAAGVTTITVVNDSGSLDSGINSVRYGWNSYVSPSYLDPKTVFFATKNGTQTGLASGVKIASWTVAIDKLSEWDGANNRWVAKYKGPHRITFQAALSDTGVTQAVTLFIVKNGAGVGSPSGQSSNYTSSVANNILTFTATCTLDLNPGDYIECWVTGTANTTAQSGVATVFSVERVGQ